MSKIIGDPNTIKLAQNAKAGDKSVYINWDAINELPDEYEAVITKVNYNIKQFADIGNGNYMPNPEVMYSIAEACGISGGDNSISQPIIEEIDINPMLCKSIEDVPCYRKMNVGRTVKKYSTILQEDGTLLKSSVCTIEFNVWERCNELWSKEEMYTDGYKKQAKYPPKYDTKYKRKAHFDSEMKFAHAKCETKAHLKTIRELAGLSTGYKKEDLKSGYLIFSKVRRSRKILNLESAARLEFMRGGVVNEQPEKLLFGDDIESKSIKNQPEKLTTGIVFDEKQEIIVEPSKRDEFIAVLNHYISTDIIAKEFQDVAKKVLIWLEENNDAEEKKFWTNSIERLKVIEDKIPEQGRITHSLY